MWYSFLKDGQDPQASAWNLHQDNLAQIKTDLQSFSSPLAPSSVYKQVVEILLFTSVWRQKQQSCLTPAEFSLSVKNIFVTVIDLVHVFLAVLFIIDKSKYIRKVSNN